MQGQTVEEVMTDDERDAQERSGGLNAEERERAQKEIWGDGDAWSNTITRLIDFDPEVQERVAASVAKKDAIEVLASVVDVMFRDRPASETAAPIARVETMRERILASLRERIAFGTPPHLIAKCACNAVLRGLT